MRGMAQWHQPFLLAYQRLGRIAPAAEAAGVSPGAVYRARKTDPDFAAAFEEAEEIVAHTIEDEMYRRAVEGVDEPVVYKGAISYELEPYVDEDGNQRVRHRLDADGNPIPVTTRVYSDALLIHMSKGRLRDRYGTERTEVSGPDGGPIVMGETERASRLASLLNALRDRKELG